MTIGEWSLAKEGFGVSQSWRFTWEISNGNYMLKPLYCGVKRGGKGAAGESGIWQMIRARNTEALFWQDYPFLVREHVSVAAPVKIE